MSDNLRGMLNPKEYIKDKLYDNAEHYVKESINPFGKIGGNSQNDNKENFHYAGLNQTSPGTDYNQNNYDNSAKNPPYSGSDYNQNQVNPDKSQNYSSQGYDQNPNSYQGQNQQISGNEYNQDSSNL